MSEAMEEGKRNWERGWEVRTRVFVELGDVVTGGGGNTSSS